MRAQHILLLLALGVASSALGYALGYVFFSEKLVDWVSGTGTGDWERGVIGNVGLQACCGSPLVVMLGSVFATLAILVDRLAKVPHAVRNAVVAALGFVSGFVVYFPLQFLLLFADAF